MSIFLFIALINSLCLAQTISFKLVNKCSDQTIWPAVQAIVPSGTHVDPTLDPLIPGLSLPPGTSVQTKPLALPWGGRIWARQFCSESGADCLIGGCSRPSCWLNSAANTTLFELHASPDKIFYDISLVDAFTIGMTVIPDNPKCQQISCQVPPYLGISPGGQPLCPVSNVKRFPTDRSPSGRRPGDVYACLSDCSVFGGDKYCCPRDPALRHVCKGASPYFKAVCPDAYSFASDDETSNKFCEGANFTIIFGCPAA